MWHLVLAGTAIWAVWAFAARALYRRWAAEAEGELGGVLAATAMAFALLLPVALAVVLMHAGERGPGQPVGARLRAMAADLDAATAELADANDRCQWEIDRARDRSDTPGGTPHE